MKKSELTSEIYGGFERHLRENERCRGTIEKYLRDVKRFLIWMPENVTKDTLVQWREYLKEKGYAPVTVNSMLAAVNSFMSYLESQGMDTAGLRVKYLRIQHRMFRNERQQLSEAEYKNLVHTAEKLGKSWLALLMETICSTGIRVSEVQYITVEAVKDRKAVISLKGKIRIILIPEKLAHKLLKYAKKQKIVSSKIFLTKNGTGISRKQIWAEMKGLCTCAGIAPSKVFPHNLRHLFATTFYRMYQDIVRLADVLGHSSMETTRIYLLTPETEHVRQLARMNLIM